MVSVSKEIRCLCYKKKINNKIFIKIEYIISFICFSFPFQREKERNRTYNKVCFFFVVICNIQWLVSQCYKVKFGFHLTLWINISIRNLIDVVICFCATFVSLFFDTETEKMKVTSYRWIEWLRGRIRKILMI